MSDEQEAINNRLATKRIGADVLRVLVRWDPLSLKGLRGADREYEKHVAALVILVKKGAETMEIARHLDRLVTKEWGLPAGESQRKKCVEIAQKVFNAGAIARGDVQP